MALDSIDGVQGVPGFPDAIDRTTGDGDDARVRTPGPAVVRTDLAGYVRQRGVLDLARAATLGAQIAGQLNESHAFALTHGVLRPDTVFVDRVDGGLAVSLSAPGAQPTGLAYLAPEIIEGEPATAAADLYSLGCLIWFMVAGAPPFRGTPEQVAEQQVTADAPHLPGTIPSVVALNALLTRLMAKDPGLRPSADEAAAALDHIVAVAEPSDITEPPLPASAQASADLNAVAPERRGPGRRGVLVGAAATAAAALGLWGISTAMTRGAPSATATRSALVSATPTSETPTPTIVPHGAARTETGSIRVGSGPHGVAVDARAQRAYVANVNDDTVSVIDLGTDTVIHQIATGRHPQSVVVDPETGIVLIGCDGAARIDVVETGQFGLVGQVGMGSGSIRIALDSVSGMAYAVAQGQSAITIISLTNYLVAGSIEVGTAPRFIGVDAESLTALVGHWSMDKLSSVSLTRRAVDEQIKVGVNPNAVAFAPGRRLAFVANYGDGASGGGSVSVVDVESSDTISTIPVDDGPSRIAVDEVAGAVYVTCQYADTIDVIDMKSLQVTNRLTGVNRPKGVAVDTSTGTLYVASFDDNVVHVFKP